ncbi:MAG: hypothetical protein WBC93_02070 [Sulfitobacter sp.]
MKFLQKISGQTALLLVAALAVGIGGTYVAMSDYGTAHLHGAHHANHDEVDMPGLRGENASATESEEIEVLFRNFETITREVENLPNGIRTFTASKDQAVMDALVNHSVGMIDRVGQMDDPKIRIQSPTLDIFFLRGDGITSNVEVTDEGLLVVQTSDDPELVSALQTHAAEVTAMAEKGMQAVHEMMMESGTGH